MTDTQSPPRPRLRDPAIAQAEVPDPGRRAKRAILLLGIVLATLGPALLALRLGATPGETARVLGLTVISVLGAFLLLRPH